MTDIVLSDPNKDSEYVATRIECLKIVKDFFNNGAKQLLTIISLEPVLLDPRILRFRSIWSLHLIHGEFTP